MRIQFTPEQKDKMIQCFGKSFVDTLPMRLADYTLCWNLSNLELIEYYSVNCLFYCCSTKHGDCVLKIFGCEHEWYIDEINVLCALEGKYRYIRVYESDDRQGALLLERIKPGTTLKLEPSLERRVEIFADIWKNSQIFIPVLSQFD